MSRLFPALRYIFFSKQAASKIWKHNFTTICSPIQNHINSELKNFIKYRDMSQNSDDIINEPARNLNYDQLIEKKKDGKTILIDVREHSEIKETGKLPDSIHIPLGELGHALGDMSQEEFQKKYNGVKPEKSAALVFSCRSGVRSRKALAQAYNLGYSNAAHYKGGWLDWEANTKKNHN